VGHRCSTREVREEEDGRTVLTGYWGRRWRGCLDWMMKGSHRQRRDSVEAPLGAGRRGLGGKNDDGGG
jgi:hypothetical protein